MTPETRKALEASLRKHEGSRSDPYLDSKELWTIGIGHLIHNVTIPAQCISVGELLTWLTDKTRHQEWFDTDVDNAIDDAARYLLSYFDHPENVQQALAEMAFQLGGHGLAKFAQMKAALVVKDYGWAAKCGLDSRWARQTPIRAREVMRLLAQQ